MQAPGRCLTLAAQRAVRISVMGLSDAPSGGGNRNDSKSRLFS
jgi:hypothetical protein